MVFDWMLFFYVILADLAVEIPIIIGLVVFITPSRTAEKTKTVLIEDSKFREDLIAMLTEDLFKPIKWKDNKGNIAEVMPIDIVSGHILTGMKQWLNGKQSEMTQEMEKGASEAMQADPTNPMQAFIMQQIPKKYRPYIQLVANYILSQRNM